ncbi:MAG: hypothetical protein ACLQUZ_01285 [Rhizomicrobium sp.]
MTKIDLSNVRGDSALPKAVERGLQPKATGPSLDTPKLDLKGGVQPKAVPGESKSAVPPAGED